MWVACFDRDGLVEMRWACKVHHRCIEKHHRAVAEAELIEPESDIWLEQYRQRLEREP